jgi:hypothetical protein
MARAHVLVKLQPSTAMVNSQNRLFEYLDRTRTKNRTKGISRPISPPVGHENHSTGIPESGLMYHIDFDISLTYPSPSPLRRCPKSSFPEIGSRLGSPAKYLKGDCQQASHEIQ